MIMSKIQMVDLIGQYTKIKEEVKSELNEILESAMFKIRENWIFILMMVPGSLPDSDL